MLHEVDVSVVGICSLAFGGAHGTKLAVGSMEASTHMIQLAHADGAQSPPEASSHCEHRTKVYLTPYQKPLPSRAAQIAAVLLLTALQCNVSHSKASAYCQQDAPPWSIL